MQITKWESVKYIRTLDFLDASDRMLNLRATTREVSGIRLYIK